MIASFEDRRKNLNEDSAQGIEGRLGEWQMLRLDG
jgi:hypothetical protein